MLSVMSPPAVPVFQHGYCGFCRSPAGSLCGQEADDPPPPKNTHIFTLLNQGELRCTADGAFFSLASDACRHTFILMTLFDIWIHLGTQNRYTPNWWITGVRLFNRRQKKMEGGRKQRGQSWPIFNSDFSRCVRQLCPQGNRWVVEKRAGEREDEEVAPAWKERERKRETLVKLARYNRKHSNLLLIRAGPSSTVPPDTEDDSSTAKFSQNCPLITARHTHKHTHTKYGYSSVCVWDDTSYRHTQAPFTKQIYWLLRPNLLHTHTHTPNNTQGVGPTSPLIVIAVTDSQSSVYSKHTDVSIGTALYSPLLQHCCCVKHTHCFH